MPVWVVRLSSLEEIQAILPVYKKQIPGWKQRQDVIHASLNSSYIWDDYTVLELTINMRLREGSDKSNIEEIKEFGDWILKMGDGRLSGTNDGEATIDIPDDMLISDNIDPIASLIEFVYLSSDSICESEGVDNTYTESLYSPEVLNGLKLSGILNHGLALKVGAPIMLLQNIDQTDGLCNGTRLRILKLGEHVIEAQIMTGTNVSHTTITPHLKLTPLDKRLPLKINRRQFPLVVLP
ncbi:ATP-dependent DNA helicase PIF1-like protein [Tanacetum coccineum]